MKLHTSNSRDKIILLIFAILTCVTSYMFGAISVSALNMESSRFKIQFGNITIGGQESESSNYELSTSLGQTAAAEFQSKGYIVKAGFQYIHTIIPFTFSVSNTKINFGPIEPNSPKTDSADLVVSFGGAGNYQVTASEDGPMRNQNNADISDTACDDPALPCSENTAKIWNRAGAYGYGYNMKGQGAPPDFVDGSYFRPFADSEKKEEAAIIMSSENVTQNYTALPRHTDRSTITFKVVVTELQQVGTYGTNVNFIATPSF